MKSKLSKIALKRVSYLAIGLASLAVPNRLAAADLEKGKQLFATCAACHGPEGQGNQLLNAPQLAGMSEWYGIAQMEKFKAGLRGSNIDDIKGAQMRPMAMILPTPEAVQSVMAYVASLETKVPESTIEGDAVKGKILYQTCILCHGDDGRGKQEQHAPSLLRLNDWYMMEQLKKFKAKVRGGTPDDVNGATMQAMTVSLVDEQAMKDVIAYIKTFFEE